LFNKRKQIFNSIDLQNKSGEPINLTESFTFFTEAASPEVNRMFSKQNVENLETMKPEQIKSSQDSDTNNALPIIKGFVIKKPSQIKNANSSQVSPNLPLHQLCMKGCYNSAYTGSSLTSYGYISIEMLKYVLCRGCRYLDFQVFYLNDLNLNQDVFVGFNNNNESSTPLQINLVNVRLYDILEAVITNGFMNSSANKKLGIQYTVPNTNDPIFIQIRTHPKSKDKRALLDFIQFTIEKLSNVYSHYFTKVKIDATTYLKDIFQKIIFVFEYDVSLFNEDRTFYNHFMKDFSVVYLDNGYFRTRLYSELNKTYYQSFSPKFVQLPDAAGKMQPMVNTNEIVVVCANNDGNEPVNVDIHSSIRDYGYQVNLLQYYVADKSSSQLIQKAENMFDSFGFSFISLHAAISYSLHV
jgi:hypothetical protein